MRLYETAFLIIPNLPEEETEQLIQQMAKVVTQKKGKMVNVDKWGKRKLAYPIQKFEDAFYVFFLYEGGPDIPAELERRFKQDENIIRYLTLKKDEKEEVKKKKRVTKTKKVADVPEKEKPEIEKPEKDEPNKVEEEQKEEERKEEMTEAADEKKGKKSKSTEEEEK